MTLEIAVFEYVSVAERLFDFIKRVVKRVFSMAEIEDSEEIELKEEGDLSPPDLGISVGDILDVGELLS